MAQEAQAGRIKLRKGAQDTIGLTILHEKLGREALLTSGEAMSLVQAILDMLEGKA